MINPVAHLRAVIRYSSTALLVSLSLILTQQPAIAADIKSSETYSLAKKISGDIEMIRMEMGIPKQPQSPVKAAGARPHDIYTQAVLLFGKVNRLAFEHTRHSAPPPPSIPLRKVSHMDVNAVLKAISQSLEDTKKAMDIPKRSSAAATAAETGDDDDVFLLLLNANNAIAKCLESRPSPANVFQTVTQAIAYASRLLERFPERERVMPDTPPFERGKMPGDNFFRLDACLKLLERIAAKSGQKMIRLDLGAVDKESVTPVEVENIASIVLSELAYLHSLLKDSKPVSQAVYPGRRFPSHVYQRIGVLEAQLLNLDHKVSKSPRWLNGEFR